MATTIVAGDTLAKGQVLNPWFDWSPVLGMPAWLFIAALLFMVLILVNLFWMFRLKRLASVRGYVDAMKKATQEDVMVWVISTTRNLTIECLRKRDALIKFYNKLRVSGWIHDSPIPVIHVGGKSAVIVSEDYYRTRDMVTEIALYLTCDQFNSEQEQMKKEFPGKVVESIKDYDDYTNFGRSILELKHPYGLRIPAYVIFDPQRFRKYFPKGLTAMLNGAELMLDARALKIQGKSQSFWEKFLPLGMFLTFAIIAMIIAWMVPLGGK
jgi:hypothetical protein